MRRGGGLVACVWALSLTPRAARAQQSPTASAEARERFARGVADADDGRLEAALVEFRRVWELTHDPFVLFNLSVTHEAMGRDADALDAMERYARDAPLALQRPRAALVRAALTRLRARVATLAIPLDVPELSVTIDDAPVDAATVRQGLRLAAGAHRVRLAAQGYHPRELGAQLAGGDRVVLDVRLEPVRAPLSIECDVAGAEVRVDGAPMGETPLTSSLFVAEGVHQVEVRRAGYVAFAATVEVRAAGQRVRASLPWAALDASTGARLTVATTPDDAVVELDGRTLDAAEGALVPPGRHHVRVARASYATLERDLDLAAGATSAQRFELIPSPSLRARWSAEAATRRREALALTVSGGAMLLAGAALTGVFGASLSRGGDALHDYYRCTESTPIAACQSVVQSDEQTLVREFETSRAWLIGGALGAGVGVGLVVVGLLRLVDGGGAPRRASWEASLGAAGLTVRW